MPAHKKTKAYLAEAAAPTSLTKADFEKAVETFLPALDGIADQAVRLSRALQSAEISEPDDDIRSLFEEAAQKHGAVIRMAGEARRLMRDMVSAEREVESHSKRLADAVAKA